MSKDSLRRTFPVQITWTSGEMPTASKLQGFSTQTSNALKVVEKAIGDLWNSSGDTTMSEWPLRLPNLARMLGPARYSSSPMLGSSDNPMSYVEDLDQHVGKNVFYLKYKPTGTINGSHPVFSSVLTSFQTSATTVDTAGEYTVDSDGKVTTFSPITAGITATYNIYLSSDGFKKLDGAEGSPPFGANLIPTYAQQVSGDFEGLKVTYSNIDTTDNGPDYWLWIPPITKLEDVDGHYYKESTPDPGTTPVWAPALTADNKSATGSRYYHNSTLDAQSGSRRYVLPREIVDLANDTLIPDGLLYLYNSTDNTVIEGVTFYTTTVAYKIKAVMPAGVILAEADRTPAPSTDETSGAYSTRYSFISVAQSASHIAHEALSTARSHQHQGWNNDGSARIEHSDLSGNVSDALDDATWTPPTIAPAFTHSNWHGDDHYQYLHRWGFNSVNDRDQYKNAMLGDFLLASTNSATNYLNLSDNSFGIFFGSGTGPKVYRDNAAGGVAIDGSDFYFAGNPSTKRIKYKILSISDWANGIITVNNGNSDADANGASAWLRTSKGWYPHYGFAGYVWFPISFPSGVIDKVKLKKVSIFIDVTSNATVTGGFTDTTVLQCKLFQHRIKVAGQVDTLTQLGTTQTILSTGTTLTGAMYQKDVYDVADGILLDKTDGTDGMYTYFAEVYTYDAFINQSEANKIAVNGVRVDYLYKTLEL